MLLVDLVADTQGVGVLACSSKSKRRLTAVQAKRIRCFGSAARVATMPQPAVKLT